MYTHVYSYVLMCIVCKYMQIQSNTYTYAYVHNYVKTHTTLCHSISQYVLYPQLPKPFNAESIGGSKRRISLKRVDEGVDEDTLTYSEAIWGSP